MSAPGRSLPVAVRRGGPRRPALRRTARLGLELALRRRARFGRAIRGLMFEAFGGAAPLAKGRTEIADRGDAFRRMDGLAAVPIVLAFLFLAVLAASVAREHSRTHTEPTPQEAR